MRVISVDVSGKVINYDDALYGEISRICKSEDDILFLTPYRTISNKKSKWKLMQLVPDKFMSSNSIIKRIFKALECLVNYCYLGIILYKEKPDILHLQWLPFLEISLVEKFFLKRYRKGNEKLSVILTIHNIYPHDFSMAAKKAYRMRFLQMIPMIEHFIVHNFYTRSVACKEFGISESIVSVIKHGAFVPEIIPQRNQRNDKYRILMYGYQSLYKGSDLLLDAIDIMPEKVIDKLEIRVVGKTSPDLQKRFNQYRQRLVWVNEFVPDEILHQEIANADILLYPYRQISQSGALLLGLAFNKPIIASNLPAFIETLDDYPISLFFQSENPKELLSAIEYYMNSSCQFKEHLLNSVDRILKANSWKVSAKDTLALYLELCQCKG